MTEEALDKASKISKKELIQLIGIIPTQLHSKALVLHALTT